MNWKLFILQILIFSGFYAQRPCAFDTTQLLEMTCEIIVNDSNSKIIELIRLDYLQEKTKVDSERCNSFYLKYIDSAQCFYHIKYVKLTNSSDFGDSLVVAVDMGKVRSLKIEILGPTTCKGSLDLSKLKIQDAAGLSHIESIQIIQYSNVTVHVNFPRWKIYKSSNAQMSLHSLKLNLGYMDKNMLKDIQNFKNLKELEIPEPMSIELKNFPQLESAIFSGPLYFFSNQLASLQHLRYYGESINVMRYDNGSYSLYAERNFFMNELDSNLTNHPVFYIDSVIRSNVPSMLEGTGKVYITGSDIDRNAQNPHWIRRDLADYSYDTDTIASGMVIDGRMTGIWRYQDNPYYYDHSPRSKIQFPDNGNWRYHYYNGTVAIEGSFKKGKKSGTWKFYDLNGEITMIKTFRKDKPYGIFINIISPEVSAIFKGPDSKTNIKLIKNGMIIKNIPQESRKYKRLMDKYELKYLP